MYRFPEPVRMQHISLYLRLIYFRRHPFPASCFILEIAAQKRHREEDVCRPDNLYVPTTDDLLEQTLDGFKCGKHKLYY